MRSFFMDLKHRNMKEALRELEKIEDWLNSLGKGWNYFGHVDLAKQRLKNAMELIKNAV